MIGNPRYGIVGMLALPYYVLFEALGPVIEISGYVVTIGALYYGLINWRYAELMFLLSVVYGTLISLAAVVLEEISYRRYKRISDLLLLIGLGVIENFGFRQLTTWWRIKGTYDFLRGQGRVGRDDADGVQHQVAPNFHWNLSQPAHFQLLSTSPGQAVWELGIGRALELAVGLVVRALTRAPSPGASSSAWPRACLRRPRRGLRARPRSPGWSVRGSRRSGRAALRALCGRPAPA